MSSTARQSILPVRGQTLDDTDDFRLMAQPAYGYDCFGHLLAPEDGYEIVPQGDVIQRGDKAFDVYAGWIETDDYDARMGHHARSHGRWTAWERAK